MKLMKTVLTVKEKSRAVGRCDSFGSAPQPFSSTAFSGAYFRYLSSYHRAYSCHHAEQPEWGLSSRGAHIHSTAPFRPINTEV